MDSLLDMYEGKSPTIELLKDLKFLNSSLKMAIEDEMEKKAQEFTLWTNGQCAYWPQYARSLKILHNYREVLGV